MTDKELKALPAVKCSLTLMPYSYYRLSSQSGYGAGNHAPAYYQRLFDERTGRPAGSADAAFPDRAGSPSAQGGADAARRPR